MLVVQKSKSNFVSVADVAKNATVVFDRDKCKVYDKCDYAVVVKPKHANVSPPLLAPRNSYNQYKYRDPVVVLIRTVNDVY